jgi:beta-N-acetylhexosaminidase
VMRLKAPFTAWAAAREWGDKDSATLSFDFGQAMGEELAAVGINVDWAPSADILTNPKNTAIGDRSFSQDAELVGKHASAFARGLLKAGVHPCVKHFPGHGNTIVDSHNELPVEDLTLATLEAREFSPFRKVFRARTEMLMTSHILYRQIDPKWPVTLSRKFLHEILREHLHYRGLIITDDLGMKAMSTNFGAEEIPVLALLAGVNILLYCNEPEVPPIALASLAKAQASGRLAEEIIQGSFSLIQEHKKTHLKVIDPVPWSEAKSHIGSAAQQKVLAALKSPAVNSVDT